MKKETMDTEKWFDNMPQHAADNALWNRIESNLNLTAALHNLPTHEAHDSLWNGIEGKLPSASRTVTKTLNWWHAAAAIVVIALGTGLFFNLQRSESSQPANQLTASHYSGNIGQLCSNHPDVCNSGDFARLNHHLNYLESEKAAIEEMARKFPDPQIEQYKGKIESDIQDMQVKILKLFF